MLVAQSATANYKDVRLNSNTTYRYKLRAISVNDVASEYSNDLTVTTKESTTTEGNWDKNKAYQAGEEVFYKTGTYKALWYTVNNVPDESDVWLLIDGTEEWSAKKAYQANAIVQYKGKEYKANVWTKGETPGISSVWKEINLNNKQ